MRILSLATSALSAYAALQRSQALKLPSSPAEPGRASVGHRALASSTRTTISDLARRLANGDGGLKPAGMPASAWKQDVQGRADQLLLEAGLTSKTFWKR